MDIATKNSLITLRKKELLLQRSPAQQKSHIALFGVV